LEELEVFVTLSDVIAQLIRAEELLVAVEVNASVPWGTMLGLHVTTEIAFATEGCSAALGAMVKNFISGDRWSGWCKASRCLRYHGTGAYVELMRVRWHSHILSVIGDIRVEGGEVRVLGYVVVVEVVREEGGLSERAVSSGIV
jgi:hypothetical protein